LDPRLYACASLIEEAAEELRRAAERARELCGERGWAVAALRRSAVAGSARRIREKLERGEPLEGFEVAMLERCGEQAEALKSHAMTVLGLARECSGGDR